jgi:U6 snRNA-associated Sm-like protein LSm4
MVECKSGDSYDGTLQACDTFMNLRLNQVIITSADGNFSKCQEAFVRGNNIKAIQFQVEVLDKHLVIVKERQA